MDSITKLASAHLDELGRAKLQSFVQITGNPVRRTAIAAGLYQWLGLLGSTGFGQRDAVRISVMLV